MRPARWPRRALVLAGVTIMGYAVLGALGDQDARPVRHMVFLAAVLVAHDAVLLPVAIGVGVLIGRHAAPVARGAFRAAGIVTATLLVVATPLVLGFGRRPDDPSALPLDYGRGLAITLLLVWAAALAATGTRSTMDRRRERAARGDRLTD